MKWFIGLATAVLLTGCQIISQLLPNSSPNSSSANPSLAASTTAQSSATDRMESQVELRINEIRQKQGLSQLRINEKLSRVARRYSKRMADENFFSHTSPSGDTMVQRVQSNGIFYLMLGENLFKSTNIAQPTPVAVQGWMDSPGHRANILRPEYRETGVGVWRKGNTYYFTQLFLRSLR